MKKLFLLAIMALGMTLTSCHITTQEEPVKPTEQAIHAYGTMTVTSSGFSKEDVHVKAVLKDNEKMDIYMFEIKFATLMPVTIDMLISDVDFTQRSSELIEFYGDSIVPTAGGKPYEKYTIHELVGKITADSIILSNKYGETPSIYAGKIGEEQL